MTIPTPRSPDETLADVLFDDEPKPISAMRWAVPAAIDLDSASEMLRWRWSGNEQWVRPGATMLERFVGLHDAEPERIAAYARTWGLLGICNHGLPSSHNPARDLDAGGVILGCEGIGGPDDEGRWVFEEPVASWHRFAREAREIALLAAALRGYGLGPEATSERRITMTLRLRSALNRWLELGSVKPAMVLHPDPGSWLSGDPETTLLPVIGASGLFGALALRLALACTGVYGLAPCSACGEWFTPDFGPREGQRQWCRRDTCQMAKSAAASRAYRARSRKKMASTSEFVPDFVP